MKFLFILFISEAFFFSSYANANANAKKNILFLGDSITEGHGVASEKTYPKLLEQKWIKDKKDVNVIASAISGSTTATGLDRFKWISKRPEIFHKIILFLGGNDVLRSIPSLESKKNLLDTLKEMNVYKEKYPLEKIEIYLVKLKVPNNYGIKKVKEWNSLYKIWRRK